jgi:hypothetical protein
MFHHRGTEITEKKERMSGPCPSVPHPCPSVPHPLPRTLERRTEETLEAAAVGLVMGECACDRRKPLELPVDILVDGRDHRPARHLDSTPLLHKQIIQILS